MGAAVPWPETIPAALAEYEAWEKVWGDRNVADGNNQCDYLSEGADLRRNHLQDMVEKLLPARDLSDLIVRMRFLIGLDRRIDAPEVILADLERLQAAETLKPARSGLEEKAAPFSPFKLNTASQRRAEVERILATREGSVMSLRDIAARAGVSPSTVLNIKRRGCGGSVICQ